MGKEAKFLHHPAGELIRSRRSVRTFDRQDPEPAVLEALRKAIRETEAMEHPFGVPVRFRLLQKGEGGEGKLGTYGVIRGARHFIGAAVPEGPLSLEALGYSFEFLMLVCTDLGLGTCWLGGTFNRSRFAAAMEVRDGELFPAVSPVGIPAERRSLTESLMRAASRGDHRKGWEALFFKGDFRTPLSLEEAGPYASVLELVRLGPSASNKQPWRILRKEGRFDFYERKSPGYDRALPFDIQRVDLGIAACHFRCGAWEAGLEGTFQVLKDPGDGNAGLEYRFTWIPD